jgi:hypothetical protein
MFELRIADCGLRIGILLIAVTVASAQESPAPTPSPIEMPLPPATTSATPSPAAPAPRSVPLRFVPPPMEGTISLGVWDSNDKLVRVLHRESPIDTLEVEENSLSTTWDGRNEAGEDLPAGKYRARGYVVGKLKIEDASVKSTPEEPVTDHISVKLVTNPLTSDVRATMELGVGFDSKGTYLKTMDNLPLASLSNATNVTRVAIQKEGEKAAQVWQDDGTVLKQWRVSNIDKIMAFDCGFFQLK